MRSATELRHQYEQDLRSEAFNRETTELSTELSAIEASRDNWRLTAGVLLIILATLIVRDASHFIAAVKDHLHALH